MKNAPTLYNLEELFNDLNNKLCSHTSSHINGRWVPARPKGLYSIKNRIQLAWMVFTGKADALLWPEGQ